MKLDTFVLALVAAVAACAGVIYIGLLLVGVVATGGWLLPVLAIVLVALGIFGVVLWQRLQNSEDDRYDKIER